MREIKFDFVWKNPKGGSFIHSYHTLEEIMGGNHYDEMSYNDMLKNYVLHAKRRFSGLKDKNRKDIYEDDIISNENDWGLNNKVVIFKYGKFGYEYAGGEFECLYYDDDIMTDDIEIVGNIYEHPELLGQDE